MVSAQNSGLRSSFEVASVKAVEYTGRPGFQGIMQGAPGTSAPGQITYSRVTLRTVLLTAFGVKEEQILGPGWLDSDRFEIIAKVPAGATVQQFRLMLQNLLADRFKLTFHRDTKDLPVYVLAVTRGGPKLQQSKVGGEPACVVSAGGTEPGDAPRRATVADAVNHRTCTNMTMTDFVEDLSRLALRYIDRPVVDLTGLKGTYDFKLEWTTMQNYGLDVGSSPTGNVGGLTMFEALEKQLGLRLKPGTAPLETIVIDHAERVPSEN